MNNLVLLSGTVITNPISFGPTSDPLVHFQLEFPQTVPGKGSIKIVAKKSFCPANLAVGSKLSVNGSLERPEYLGKDGKMLNAFQVQVSKVELIG